MFFKKLINAWGCSSSKTACASRVKSLKSAVSHSGFIPFFSPEALSLAQRESAGVDVHLGDSDKPQRGREAEARGDRALAQQVRQLVPLLQAEGGVVEHPAVQVARLLDLQLVDVTPNPHELPRQLLVLQAHICLQKTRERRGGGDLLLLNDAEWTGQSGIFQKDSKLFFSLN